VRADCYIDGQWAPAASGRRFPVENPATEEVLAEVAAGDAADIDAAVRAARACFESDLWQSKTSARQRGRMLMKAADLLESRLAEFAELETRQNGKLLFESKIEIGMSAEVLRYFGGWADKISGDTLPVSGSFFTYTLKEPVGVVGAITPWNFPLNLAVWKFAPALAAGCAVVSKPPSEAPLTIILFAEILEAAGFPSGAFNVVPGSGSVAGSALVAHPGVDKISFTGSTEVGKGVMKSAADSVKRVTLELGGKSPNIIFADADIPSAIKGAQNAIFYSKGEVCAAGSRLVVERSVHDQVVNELAARAKKLTVGDPLDKATRLGAVVSKKQQQTVLGYIEKGTNEGASLVAGGHAAQVNGKGYYVEATIFDGVTPEMTIAREEIFGPVLAVQTFDDFDQAVALGNQSMYGLAAGIWTKDIQKAHRTARAIKAGTVWINSYNFYDPAAPFGGYKASGFGRDLGAEALAGYLETKTVWVAL
jgi:acyl-CoA reductase-like NAD-dependent aldehyde dehydrogenase